MGLKYRFKTQPYSHQLKALNKLVKLKGRGGLIMEMATGKTKVAIDYAGLGFYNWGLRRVLVVGPLTGLGVWPLQLEKHAPYPWKATILSGSTKQKIAQVSEYQFSSDRVEFMIINYESVWREKLPATLIKCRFDLVIFDESHRIKTSSSRQSRGCATIAKEIPERLLLTGTFITEKPLDSFAQFRAMNPEIFPMSWTKFRLRYGRWGGFGGYQLIKYLRVPEITQKIRDNTFIVKKSECLDLPDKVSVVLPVTLSATSKAKYDRMAKEMIVELEQSVATASIALTKVLRLQQITSGFIKDELGEVHTLGHEKLDLTLDLIDQAIESQDKVVVFCKFIHEIEQLAAALVAAKVGYRILSGSVHRSLRDSFIADFHSDPKVKVFIAQVAAGSEAIDLTPANILIFPSLPQRAIQYLQAMARIDRPGQTKKMTFYHLVCPRTVDVAMLRSLRNKEKLAEAILHDPKILLNLDIPELDP